MKYLLILIFFNLSVLAYAGEVDSLKVSSSTFFAGETMPEFTTCEGEDTSPALKWSDAPDGTKSFAIIADDPDAPNTTWVHWIVYDIPASVTFLEEGQGSSESIFHGAKHGVNDFGNKNYGGPCPPAGHGVHRYYFKVYALDEMLDLEPGPSKAELLEAMEGHILAKGSIKGLYERP